MTQANERQVAGTHYSAKVQHWDWVVQTHLPYLPAQVSKYLTRWRKKNGLQDLEKALHFLEKFIEEEKARRSLHADLTDEFLQSNGVGSKESAVIWAVVRYQCGNMSNLETACDTLKSLIGEATTPPPVAA